MKLLVKRIALSAVLLGALSTAFAQADFSFSLTEGGFLRATLLTPLEFTVVTAPTSYGAAFIFDGVGNALANGGANGNATGTLTFTVNNGAPITLDYIGNGGNYLNITPDDLYILSFPFFAANEFLQLGDVVRLSAGEMISGTQPLFVPAAGTFAANLMDNNTTLLSTGAVAAGSTVPEPSTATALAGLAILGFAASRRRR
ncbi:MAG: PEP-CTERM sorting domain-containing protein [Opitutaceae bacterium]|jgi:hypothetical protein|nr:PEP-CTERM sorting domain-containing protein [Opitutaceae bacterium]